MYITRIQPEDDDEDIAQISTRKIKKQAKKKNETAASKPLTDIMNWQKSPEYKSFQAGVVDITLKLELEFDREFVSSLTDYQLLQSSYQAIQKKTKLVKG